MKGKRAIKRTDITPRANKRNVITPRANKRKVITPSAVRSDESDMSLVRDSDGERPSRLIAKFGMRRDSFYKVAYEKSLTTGPRIPPKFMESIPIEKVPEYATLQALSNGRRWRVKLEKREDGIFFADRWEVFCKRNGVNYMDLLLFTHVGNFLFTVDIYDKSGNRV